MSIPSIAPVGVASIVAGPTSANVLLPTGGTTALVTNMGTSPVYIALGDDTVTVSAETGVVILPSQSLPLTIGENTYLAALSTGFDSGLNIVVGN